MKKLKKRKPNSMLLVPGDNLIDEHTFKVLQLKDLHLSFKELVKTCQLFFKIGVNDNDY